MTDSKPASNNVIGPVQQFQFLLYASKDTRLSACDMAVLAELTNRYVKKDFGRYKAGVTLPSGYTHLTRETGYARTTIMESLARLRYYGYIAVADEGAGTRGSTYLINFNWSCTVAEAVAKEIDARKTAKKKRRRASVPENQHTKAETPVCRPSVPLRELVLRHADTLTNLVLRKTGTETYMKPKGFHIGDADAAGGLKPPPPVISKKITAASVEVDDGETILIVEFDDASLPDVISLESDSASEQEAGQERLNRMLTSTGLGGIDDDAAALVGCTVYTQGNRYVPPPDNDNMQDAA